MFEHYVVFKPKPGRGEQLTSALAEFGNAVRDDLPGLIELIHGENINQSGLDRGYTHGCFARLTSQDAFKNEYWHHPAHLTLVRALDELCEDRFAIDFVVDESQRQPHG